MLLFLALALLKIDRKALVISAPECKPKTLGEFGKKIYHFDLFYACGRNGTTG